MIRANTGASAALCGISCASGDCRTAASAARKYVDLLQFCFKPSPGYGQHTLLRSAFHRQNAYTRIANLNM